MHHHVYPYGVTNVLRRGVGKLVTKTAEISYRLGYYREVGWGVKCDILPPSVLIFRERESLYLYPFEWFSISTHHYLEPGNLTQALPDWRQLQIE